MDAASGLRLYLPDSAPPRDRPASAPGRTRLGTARTPALTHTIP
ncbi:hypothetical protein [Nocardiopsis synnemataformans]